MRHQDACVHGSNKTRLTLLTGEIEMRHLSKSRSKMCGSAYACFTELRH